MTAIYDQINDSNTTALVLLDFKKAFDTVSHTVLLKKLEHYGITGVALNLLKSFLSNRQQCIAYENQCSNLKTNRFGVPQGSNLGPLLFLIYINDVPNKLHTIPRLFADDTCLIIHESNTQKLEETINDELQKVHEWTKTNKITINLKSPKP